MEELINTSLVLLATVLSILGGYAAQVLRAYVNKLAAEHTNLIQQRVGTGAERIAGEIISQLINSDSVKVATNKMIESGVAALASRFPDTAGKMPVSTLTGIIIGELGKKGVAVEKEFTG